MLIKMKGISAIIVVILMLTIVIALIALSFMTFTTMFKTTSGGAEKIINQTTGATLTSFKIEAAKGMLIS